MLFKILFLLTHICVYLQRQPDKSPSYLLLISCHFEFPIPWGMDPFEVNYGDGEENGIAVSILNGVIQKELWDWSLSH